MRAFCVDCGAPFRREADETWRKRCIPCYKKSKPPTERIPTDSYWRDRATVAEQKVESAVRQYAALLQEVHRLSGNASRNGIDRELAEQLPRLLLVCHPDRHGNSEASTKATQWLLSVRGRLQ